MSDAEKSLSTATKVKNFVKRWIINTLAVLAAVYLVPGLEFHDQSLWAPFLTSLVLGILNAFIRPIMMFMALPLLVFTLGFFTLVINALLLKLVGLVMGGYFEVRDFWAALLGALIISIVSTILNLLTGTSNARIRVARRSNRPSSGDPGNGPVIDI